MQPIVPFFKKYMVKEVLKEKEPFVYQSLALDIKNNKVAHSYLFSGEYSPLKSETAIFLAQSIVEGKWACEECETCKRIRQNAYFDVIVVDGYQESIKKEDIENIMDEFSRTSLEKSGKKVYILKNINNSSSKVFNMILKFMEEPSNEDTYGIFLTDNKEALLPTIVSRCRNVEFRQRDFSYLMKEYEKHGFDDLDAYLLSNLYHEFKEDLDLNDPIYLVAKEYVYKTIENFDHKDHIPYLFFKEFYTSFKQKEDFKLCSDLYLKIFLKMIEDAIEDNTNSDREYQRLVDTCKRHNVLKLFEIVSNALDTSCGNINRNLLFDGLCYEIISYV